MTARIVLAPGNPGPVNDGERRVLERLTAELPDGFELHPNLQVTVGHGGLTETDIIVFGPDCMWVIEVKDLAGEVVVGQHDFVVNGEPRPHPVSTTRLKAQKIKSRLAVHPDLTKVWIQPLVVLARTPRTLRLDPTMTKHVVTIDRAAQVIGNPSSIGLLEDKLPTSTRELAKSRLALGTQARTPRSRFGAYLAEEKLSENGPLRWWRARHEVFATEVLLEVLTFDALADAETKSRRREALLRAARVGRLLGAHPNLLAPETAFTADDGSLVVVHPISPNPTLAATDVEELDDAAKRRVVAGVARLLAHCERRGVAHRTLGPGVVHVAPNGTSRVAGFAHARVDRAPGATVAPSDWSALGGDFWMAPEHLGGDVEHPADLFALGKLIEALWPDGPPADLADATTSLTVAKPADRKPSAAEVSALAVRAEPVKPQPTAGATVAGRFALGRRLGSGAHATVWQASDVVTGHQVAIKLFESDDAGDQLVREYDALLDLDHDAIVKVRDATKLDDRWALVTEFLDGPDLRAVMVERGAVDVEEGVPLALRLLDGLRHLHPDTDEIERLIAADDDAERLARVRSKGFAHRDVKPENIILVEGRGPVLVDFGLASRPGDGVSGGTAAYRPPDVVPDGSDPDVDLFAVGVILHELVTGRHPYSGRDPVTGDFDVSGDIPPALASVIERACAPKHADRFVSASHFIDELAVLGIDDRPLPEPSLDIVDQLRQIENAIADHRWDDALELCPEDWDSVRDRIERRRGLDEGAEERTPLIDVDGVSLTHVGQRPFATAKDTGGNETGPGVVDTYLVRGRANEIIEVLQYRSADSTTWVQGGDTFQTGMPLERLGHGLRLSTSVDGDRMLIELRVARFTNDEGWSNLFQASVAELNEAAGTDVAAILTRFGGEQVGTREEVAGETGRRRNYACVVGHADAEHLPAVAHFVTRVLPLTREDDR